MMSAILLGAQSSAVQVQQKQNTYTADSTTVFAVPGSGLWQESTSTWKKAHYLHLQGNHLPHSTPYPKRPQYTSSLLQKPRILIIRA
jgi:hypothetical protein